MILRIGAFIFINSCVSLGYAESANRLSPDSGLALFMSAEEQQALEQRQSALSLSDSGASPEEVSDEANEATSENTGEDSGDEKADKEAEPVLHSANSHRYDGIVMKGNRVLGLWFDGSRVSDIEEFTNTDLSVVNSGGQLQLLKDEQSVILYPGDTYSPRRGLVLNPALALLESLTDSVSEVRDSETILIDSNPDERQRSNVGRGESPE